MYAAWLSCARLWRFSSDKTFVIYITKFYPPEPTYRRKPCCIHVFWLHERIKLFLQRATFTRRSSNGYLKLDSLLRFSSNLWARH
jgi:hypothetical protein